MPGKKSTIVSAAEFLEAYKYLEQMIRDAYGSNKTVADYEQTLPDGDRIKMSTCRRCRNYIQHNTDGESFVAITEAMLSFIKSHGHRIESERLAAGKMARRLKALSETDGVREISAWLYKYGATFAPVVNDRGQYLGSVTNNMLLVKLTMISGSLSSKANQIKNLWKNDLSQSLTLEHGHVIRSSETIKDPHVIKTLDEGGMCVVVNAHNKYVGVVSQQAGNW